ncbi:glycerophosphodiester phosphodiesterase [Halovenus salina]|uniref:Glycerophosphodiester phosphodiesterase n=1 Tax=Halovenus salina TaxID=1510225 RepID=A0ABD5W4H2_9EURY
MNVELKHAGMAEAVATELRERECDAILSSFAAAALEPFREEPLPTAYLFRDGFETGLDTAAALGCAFVHPQHAMLDAAAIEQAHDSGFAVNAWTVPDETEVSRLREAGVDGVIVDSWQVVST